jgi:RNA polymerase sigma-70 factor (ECF subfamily)
MASEAPEQRWGPLRARLIGYLRQRLNDSAAAEDIAQETLLRVVRVARGEALESAEALAFRIADNLVIDHYRSRSGRALEPIPEDLAAKVLTPEEALVSRQRAGQLLHAIRAMPRLRREVFLRRRYHGQSCQAIAASLGLTERAVEAHIARALRDLAAIIKKQNNEDAAS